MVRGDCCDTAWWACPAIGIIVALRGDDACSITRQRLPDCELVRDNPRNGFRCENDLFDRCERLVGEGGTAAETPGFPRQ